MNKTILLNMSKYANDLVIMQMQLLNEPKIYEINKLGLRCVKLKLVEL